MGNVPAQSPWSERPLEGVGRNPCRWSPFPTALAPSVRRHVIQIRYGFCRQKTFAAQHNWEFPFWTYCAAIQHDSSTLVHQTCVCCGSTFTLPGGRGRPQVYCSKACYPSNQGRQLTTNRCLTCGTTYTPTARRGPVSEYCSRPCRMRHRLRPPERQI
jgi:hypothetical protein